MFFKNFGVRLFFLRASLSASTQQERFLNHSNSTRFSKKSIHSALRGGDFMSRKIMNMYLLVSIIFG
jgi:hypothetical protein